MLIFRFASIISLSDKTPYANNSDYAMREIKMPFPVSTEVDDTSECRVRSPHAWSTDDAFHAPLWRARIEIFQAIESPWFEYPYSADG